MQLHTGADALVNAASAALIAALGLALSAVRPRRALNVAFAAFATTYGIVLAADNLVHYPTLPAPWRGVRIALLVTCALALLGLAQRLAGRGPRRHVAWAATLAFGFLVATIWRIGADDPLGLHDQAAYLAMVSAWWYLLALLALRHGTMSPAHRRQSAWVAAALAVWPSVWVGYADPGVAMAASPQGVPGAIVLVVLAGLWLANASRRLPGAGAWACVAVAWACLAPGALNAAARLAFDEGVVGGPQYAVARLLGVGILGYAIARHQLFGLDLGLKRALVAAVACAAWGATFGALVTVELALGLDLVLVTVLAATGATAAFALMAPAVLRMARRLADRAMPNVQETRDYFRRRRLEMYAAWLPETRDDSSAAALQQRLGITRDEHALVAAAQGQPALQEARLGPYVRQMRRRVAMGLSGAELTADLQTLRADLGVTDQEHAILETALRTSPAPLIQEGHAFLARYRIERRLGQGSFGTTYLAWDEKAGRSVVLKTLRSPAHSAEAIAHALSEARRLAALSHPTIVTLYDVEVVGSEAILVQEHLSGGSLKDRLVGGPLPAGELGRLARDLLSALDAVHRHGLVHGDVKPGNVLYAADGTAKLADFGLAHVAGFESTLGPGGGPVAGTLRYMSPEVARGMAPTARSDMFSAAATLYEAWTGSPYRKPLPQESAASLQARAARSGGLPPGAPTGPAAAWLDRALARSPRNRPSSAQAMMAAMPALLRRAQAPRARERSRRGEAAFGRIAPAGSEMAGASP